MRLEVQAASAEESHRGFLARSRDMEQRLATLHQHAVSPLHLVCEPLKLSSWQHDIQEILKAADAERELWKSKLESKEHELGASILQLEGRIQFVESENVRHLHGPNLYTTSQVISRYAGLSYS